MLHCGLPTDKRGSFNRSRSRRRLYQAHYELGLILYIINTHAHIDHIGANEEIKGRLLMLPTGHMRLRFHAP